MSRWIEDHTFSLRGIEVHKYHSKHTGLRVVVGKVPSPIVSGNIAVATEASDDAGCPHVLEHLVFLGSKRYPWKGVLDKLANRCLAQGTNAWTDVDHTNYTLTTAGSEGFLQLLPIYMDHVLFPTLTESGFLTEVHHVNGEGEDAGVVYSEMQACENTDQEILERRLRQCLYPNGSGYACETGGKMKDLRELTVERIREYHAEFYRAENTSVIITGEIDPLRVLESLVEADDRLIEVKVKNQKQSENAFKCEFERPWISPLSPSLTDIDEEVLFPADSDSEDGLVALAWRGPDFDDFEHITALDIMWEYLTDSPVSPIGRTMIDVKSPYASEAGHSIYSFKESSFAVMFENVPASKLNSVKKVFIETIAAELSNGIDMKRMNTIIHREKQRHFLNFEDSPHGSIVHAAIDDFIYADMDDSKLLYEQLNMEPLYSKLAEKDSEYWAGLIGCLISHSDSSSSSSSSCTIGPMVCIRGRPSKALSKSVEKEETARVKENVKKFGVKRLAELSEELAAATDDNEKPIPDWVHELIHMPDVSSIPLTRVVKWNSTDSSTSTSTNTDASGDNDADDAKLRQHILGESEGESDSFVFPVPIQFDQVKSDFLRVSALIDTACLPDALRPYLEVYLEAVIDTASKTLTREEMVEKLNSDTVHYTTDLGFNGDNFKCGEFAQVARVSLMVEATKYAVGIQWLHDLLFNAVFTVDSISVATAKLMQDISERKRDEGIVCDAVHSEAVFDKRKSNHSACNLLQQISFLDRTSRRLKKESQQVMKEIQQFVDFLVNKNESGIVLHVSGDIMALEAPKGPFASSNVFRFSNYTAEADKQWFKVIPSRDLRIDNYDSKSSSSFDVSSSSNSKMKMKEKDTEMILLPNVAYVSGVASTTSSYLIQSIKLPLLYEDPDSDGLRVLLELLSACEGILWKKIRGKGLAYGFYFSWSVELGSLEFTISQSGHVVEAYKETIKVISELLKAKELGFSALELEEAKSSLAYALVSSESTPSKAARQSILRTMRGVSDDYTSKRLSAIAGLTVSDLQRLLREYVSRLFLGMDTYRDRSSTNDNVNVNTNINVMSVCGPKGRRKGISKSLVEMDAWGKSGGTVTIVEDIASFFV